MIRDDFQCARDKSRNEDRGIIYKMAQHTSTPRLGIDMEITGVERGATQRHLRLRVSPSTNKDGFFIIDNVAFCNNTPVEKP
jgi:hypothetical protein